MTNKLVVIINSLKVPKVNKILLYEVKFLVPNYSCLQNPWLGGYCPQIPVLSVLCPQLNLFNPSPPEQNSWIRHWCWPPSPCRSRNDRMHYQKWRVFMTWKNPGHLASRTEFYGYRHRARPVPVSTVQILTSQGILHARSGRFEVRGCVRPCLRDSHRTKYPSDCNNRH